MFFFLVCSSLSVQPQFKGVSIDQEKVCLDQCQGKSSICWGSMFVLSFAHLSTLNCSLKECLLTKRRFASTNVRGIRWSIEAVSSCSDLFAPQQLSPVLPYLACFTRPKQFQWQQRRWHPSSCVVPRATSHPSLLLAHFPSYLTSSAIVFHFLLIIRMLSACSVRPAGMLMRWCTTVFVRRRV